MCGSSEQACSLPGCQQVIVEPMHSTSLPAKYQLSLQIGKGNFATVFSCHDIVEDQPHAVKVLPKARLTRIKDVAKVRSEISIHSSLNHERLVQFVGCHEDDVSVYLILEFCPHKTLSELLQRRSSKRLSEDETAFYMSDLLPGLKYLHDRRIIHRDLKLQNLFLDGDMRVKIGDLGLAIQVTENNKRPSTKCGTPNYIAPEILRDECYSFEVDIWSLGIVAYVLLCGQPPFQDADVTKTLKRVKGGQFQFPSQVPLSEHATDFVASVLSVDPRQRPTLDSLLGTPLLLMAPSAVPTTITDMFLPLKQRLRNGLGRVVLPNDSSGARAPRSLKVGPRITSSARHTDENTPPHLHHNVVASQDQGPSNARAAARCPSAPCFASATHLAIKSPFPFARDAQHGLHAGTMVSARDTPRLIRKQSPSIPKLCLTKLPEADRDTAIWAARGSADRALPRHLPKPTSLAHSSSAPVLKGVSMRNPQNPVAKWRSVIKSRISTLEELLA